MGAQQAGRAVAVMGDALHLVVLALQVAGLLAGLPADRINRGGGALARGHPIGATGVSQHVMAAMQLAGEAGAMQVPGAELAGVFNMGGTAVANYCSILEREK